MAVKFNRNDYMHGRCDRQTYFSQFVTNGVLNLVVACFGKHRITSCTSEHFTEIPMDSWNIKARLLSGETIKALVMANDPENSKLILNDRVEVMKAAAYMIRKNPSII